MRTVTLLLASLLVFIVTRSARAQSCEGDCGGPGGGCWCDDACQQYGDCCGDFVTACKRPVIEDLVFDFATGVLAIAGRELGITTGAVRVSVGGHACGVLGASLSAVRCHTDALMGGRSYPVVVTRRYGPAVLTSEPMTLTLPVVPAQLDVRIEGPVRRGALALLRPRWGELDEGAEAVFHRGTDAELRLPLHLHLGAGVATPALYLAMTDRLDNTFVVEAAGHVLTEPTTIRYDAPIIDAVSFDGANVVISGVGLGGFSFEATIDGRPCPIVGMGADTLACAPSTWESGELVLALFDHTTAPQLVTLPDPIVTSASGSLRVDGNGTLTIEGERFGVSATVTFDGAPQIALDVTPERIALRPPPHRWGPVAITLTTRGVTLPIEGLSYDPPNVHAVVPSSGRVGDQVDIVVTDAGVGAVTIGGYEADVVSRTATVIRARVPVGGGAAPVAIDGFVSTVRFTYSAPELSSVSAGRVAVGDTLTLEGRGFGRAGAVTIGGALCLDASWSDARVDCRVPDVSGQALPVVVDRGDTRSNALIVATDGSLGSLEPTHGPGGTIVIVRGASLAQWTSFRVGPQSALVVSRTPTEVVLVTPTGSGSEPVVGVSAAGESNPLYFAYDRPTLTSIEPAVASAGAIVTVRGSDLGSAIVSIDGRVATPLRVTASEQDVVVPVGAGKDLTVELTDPSGRITTAATFSYPRPIVSAVEGSGSLLGDPVIVHGNNFGPGARVLLDGVDLQIMSAGPTRIEALTPPGSGAGHTLVVVAGGQASLATTWAYARPSLHFHAFMRLGDRFELTFYGTGLASTVPVPVSVTIGGVLCPVSERGRWHIRCRAHEAAPSSVLPVVITVAGQTPTSAPFVVSYPSLPAPAPRIAVDALRAETSGGPLLVPVEHLSPGPVVVRLDDQLLSVASFGSDALTVMIPAGVGAHTLTVVQGSGSPTVPFMYDAPRIDVSPTSITAGALVTLEGASFGPSGSVTIEGHACAAISYSHTRITCVAPDGGGDAVLEVRVAGRVASVPIRYPAPILASLSSAVVPAFVESTITLVGTSFGPTPLVELDGEPLRATVIGPSRLALTVPPADGRGHTLRVVAGGVASNVLTFDYAAPPPDADGDGVGEALDACPDTPPGEVVLPDEGCSVGQLCPCVGPTGVGSAWASHASYVDCVHAALDELGGDAQAPVLPGCGVDPCAASPLTAGGGPAPKLTLRLPQSKTGQVVYLGTTPTGTISGTLDVPLIDKSGKVIIDALQPGALDGTSSIPKGALVVMRRGKGDVVLGLKGVGGSATAASVELDVEVRHGRLGTVHALSLEGSDALWQVAPRYSLTATVGVTHDLVGHRVCR